MSVEGHKKTLPSTPGLRDPSQTLSTSIDPSRLTLAEKRLYGFLRSKGWTDKQSSSFVTHIEPMKEALSHHFYSQGWSTDQLQRLHERCQMDFPETLPAPTGDADQQDLQMQLRLVEEMNRRKAISERMYPSTGTIGRGIAEQGRT